MGQVLATVPESAGEPQATGNFQNHEQRRGKVAIDGKGKRRTLK